MACPWLQVGLVGPDGWGEVWDSDAQARAGSLGKLRSGWPGAVEGLDRAAAGTPGPAQEPFRRVQAGPGQKHTRELL